MVTQSCRQGGGGVPLGWERVAVVCKMAKDTLTDQVPDGYLGEEDHFRQRGDQSCFVLFNGSVVFH